MRALAAAVRRWPYRATSSSISASTRSSTTRRAGSSSCQATISRAPRGERDRRDVVGDQGADLGVVEHHRVRLVAQQRAPPALVGGEDRLGGDVDEARLRAGRGADELGDLVPRAHLVGGDVEAVADRLGMAEQPDEGLGEVDVMSECPQRGAVALHDDLLAPAHALDDRPAALEGQVHAVVGVRGPHDRGREAVLAVGAHQELLARDQGQRCRSRAAARRGSTWPAASSGASRSPR